MTDARSLTPCVIYMHSALGRVKFIATHPDKPEGGWIFETMEREAKMPPGLARPA